MNLIVVDPYTSDIEEKLKEFQKEKNINIEYFNKLFEVKKQITKEEYDKQKENSININEITVNIVKDRINNVCVFNGTKDNKLVELKIYNLKDGNNEINRNFVKNNTEYALSILNAETISIFSNNSNDQVLIENGYESIGEYNGVNTYIMDKQKIEEIGNRSK